MTAVFMVQGVSWADITAKAASAWAALDASSTPTLTYGNVTPVGVDDAQIPNSWTVQVTAVWEQQ